MRRFASRVVRVNEMGGKFYVEIKNKQFGDDQDKALVDTVEVKVFDRVETAEQYIDEQLP